MPCPITPYRALLVEKRGDGGRLLTIPASMLSSQPVTLGDEIMTLLAAGVVIIVANSGTTTQFTDEQGRTLFQTPGVQVVNQNLSARIPNLMPVLHRQATFGGVVPELYFWCRDDGPLRGVAGSRTWTSDMHTSRCSKRFGWAPISPRSNPA